MIWYGMVWITKSRERKMKTEKLRFESCPFIHTDRFNIGYNINHINLPLKLLFAFKKSYFLTLKNVTFLYLEIFLN